MRSFNSQKVTVDKITYTIKMNPEDIHSREEAAHNHEALKNLMRVEFGKFEPKITRIKDNNTNEIKTIRGVQFDNKLWISESLPYGWCRLNFCRDQVDLHKLKTVLSEFDSTYINEKRSEVRAQNIRDIEIAFDLDVGECSEEKLIKIIKLITKYIRPVNIKNTTYNCIEGESQTSDDGTENGECTIYFNPKSRKPEQVDSNYYSQSGMTVKIYAKSICDDDDDEDDNDSTWDSDTVNDKKTFIRIEAKLDARYFRNIVMKNLDAEMFELDKIVKYIKDNIKFTDFFEFIKLDLKGFFDYAQKHIDPKSNEFIRIKEKIKECESNARRLSLMKGMAKLAKTRTMSNRIKKYVKKIKYKIIRKKIDKIIDS